MTDNPFAALLAKIGRYSHDCDEPHLVPEPDGKWLDRDEVLAALAAAVPADLAEAGKVVERLEDEAITLSGIGINRGSVDASLSAQAADEAADLITALLARIAAQEAQMKGLGAEITATDDLMAADSCRIAALETALAAEREKVARLVEAGPPFFFDRYINGVRMAEDVCVERETTLEGAMRVAARIAAKGPNGEPPVLVYRSTETAALAAITEAGQ